MEIRHCERCGVELVRRSREAAYLFARRRFCSVTCAAKATHSKPVPPARVCEECGGVIKRVTSSGRRMVPGEYARRRYCSVACRHESQRVAVLKPRRGPVEPATLGRVDVSMDPAALLRAALRVHPDLLAALAEVESNASRDLWEPYNPRAVRSAA